jgi:hypothetical protein
MLKKIFFTALIASTTQFSIQAQDSYSEIKKVESWRDTEKGKDLMVKLESGLEKAYNRDMILKPEFEAGMNLYVHQFLGLAEDSLFAKNSAHRHLRIGLKDISFEQLPNEKIVEWLTENHESHQEWQKIVRPNKFFLELYQYQNEFILIYAEDRPFNYETWTEEE